MAEGRAAGLVNLAYIDEPEEDLERTAVGAPAEWTDDDDDLGDPTAVTAVHALEAFAQASEADADDPTHVEREAPVRMHANDTSPPLAQKSDVRALSPTRLGPQPPPGVQQAARTSTLIPPVSQASRVQSVPPEPMLFTPSAMPPPPRATPATAATYPTIVPPAFSTPAPTPKNGTPAALSPQPLASPPPPATSAVPPPTESSVLPLSREITEPPPAPVPRPEKTLTTKTKIGGLLFMPPASEGSIVVPVTTPSEGVISSAPKTEPAPPPRPASPSFDDLRDLVERRSTEPLAKHPVPSPLNPIIPPPPPRPSMLEACAPVPSWELAEAPPLPQEMLPAPNPRASALGLEVHFAPPEKALESILPPAPEMVPSDPSGVPVVAPLGQMAIETVKPPAPGGGALFMTMIFFVGYVFRAGFGRVVDASAQIGELGREIFEALKVEWFRAQRRAHR